MFKTHIFWKKAIFSVKNCICPIFVRIVECGTPQETIYKSQKDILTINVEVKRPIFRTLDVVDNTNFGKKVTFPVNKCVCPIFSQIFGCDKPQERIYKSQKDISTINVQVTRAFLGPERLLKTQIFEKKQFSSEQMYLPHTFSNFHLWQTSGNDLLGSKRYSDNYCGSNKIIL